MIEYLILIFVAGICFGYGLKTGIKDVIRSIRYHLWAFWNYKILGKPEPDLYETMMGLMPLALMAGVMGSVVDSLQTSFGKDEAKEKLQTVTKKKDSKLKRLR